MAIDWTKSMKQTFEFWEVDPKTWFDKGQITTIKSASITRDNEDETLQHASFEAVDLDLECYIRVYLVVTQDRQTYREPLGTFLVQTPSKSFDGKIHSTTLDAYSPLTEMKEKYPPIGYCMLEGQNIMSNISRITAEQCRAPVVTDASSDAVIEIKNGYVANTDDNWLSFCSSLIKNSDHEYAITSRGEIYFKPVQDVASLQPRFTYSDDNSSILLPDIQVDRDLYGIPNVVEVVHSVSDRYYVTYCINDDPNSPISTVNRGREIVHRANSPDTLATGANEQIDAYAEQLLRNLSTLEYRVSYSHGYNGVEVGDCVRLNYIRAGLTNIKAKVTSQTIQCETGCTVSETAVFTNKLWG